MKKAILLLSLALLNQCIAIAQCQPEAAITNIYQPVGALPLPTDGLLKPSNFFAYPGQPFSQVITALAPQQTTVDNPLGIPPTITVTLNWIRVTNINNLPAWVSYQCGGQLDPLDPCKMAYPTWSCVNAYANTANGKVPMNEVPGTIYSLDVIVDANVSVLGTQSNYSGGSISLFILDSMTNALTFDPCNGGKISANPFGGFNDPGAFVYTWSSGQQTQEISNVQNGWYSCTVLDQVTGWSATDSVYVSGVNPAITISDVAVTQPTVTNDGAITASAVGGTGALTFAWTGPNGFTAQGASISNLFGGYYILMVTDSAGCTKTKTYYLSALGLTSLEFTKKINLFPNPSKGVLNVKGLKESGEAVSIEVHSTSGNLVYKTTLQNPSSKIQLNLPRMDAGNYEIHIQQGENLAVKRLIIAG